MSYLISKQARLLAAVQSVFVNINSNGALLLSETGVLIICNI